MGSSIGIGFRIGGVAAPDETRWDIYWMPDGRRPVGVIVADGGEEAAQAACDRLAARNADGKRRKDTGPGWYGYRNWDDPDGPIARQARIDAA